MSKRELQNEVFLTRYKALNKSQKDAVDTTEGPVMVIAGPGTGKTTILTLRIANIIKQGLSPANGILALTFTDSGVKAMRLKLREIIGSLSDEVRIHTFHSFSASVIAEFPEHFPAFSKAKQLTDVETESLIRKILKEKKYSKLRPFSEPDLYLHKIISTISDSKKEAWSPDIVKAFAEAEIKRIKSAEDSISTRGKTKGELKADVLKKIDKCEKTILFANIYAEYEKIKREEKRIDYDDLLLLLIEAMKNDELLLRLLQEKFLYILVDEHQDTNDSQNMIVLKLADFFENPNVFVVGDEKQAIYRFQGASVENFLKFQKAWKDMKVISLSENFRSHQSILDASFSMIGNNYEEDSQRKLHVKLLSKSKALKKPVEIIFSPDFASSDVYLIEELKKIPKDKTAAVILRWNREVDHVLSLCKRENLGVSAERGIDVFSNPFGRAFFEVLEFLGDYSKTEILAETLASGLWGLSFSVSSRLIKEIKSGNLQNIEKEIPQIKTLKEQVNNVGVISFIISAGELSGLVTDESMRETNNIEVWRTIVDLSGELARDLNISDPKILIAQLIDYKRTAEKKVIKIGSGDKDSRIQIMTAHSSKGLEYDYVFLPYSTEEYWMRKSRNSGFTLPREKDLSDENKDARRLFYVALTRAKEHVVIIVPKEDNFGGEVIPLRFIEELNPKDLKKIEQPKIKERKISIKDIILNSKEIELLEYSKRILLENGLSVTALNHFLECPSQFLYKSILKVPEAPNGNSEKGIAMHKAISEVWKEEAREHEEINTILQKAIRSHLSLSLLPFSEKETILEELLNSAPVVSKALEEHFGISGKVFTDRWFESSFETQYKNENLRIRIHGQMDSIVEQDTKALVFDYKTKKAMSINAIKGETENENGNYLRQLIFYKLLLSKGSPFSNKEIVPALVFVRPDDKGRCPTITLPIENEDIKRVKSEIEKLVQSVFSGDFLKENCDDPKCPYCLKKRLFK
jgi:DNA helicase-2/ATP-dependent DNA helicase PcrA